MAALSARQLLETELTDYVTSLRRYALVLTKNADTAEDLVQETLTKAIAASDQWEPGSDLRVWLFRIMHNTHVSEGRRAQVRENAKIHLTEPVTHEDPTRRIELQQVLTALDELPDDQKQPIVLVALKSLSYADAAKILNIPIGTLYSRLGRGRKALRKLMDRKKPGHLRIVN
jgi:RNA polymerase sigma-70 factor (ECF subfamily)